MKKNNFVPTVLLIFLMGVSMLPGNVRAQSVQTWSEPINLSMSGAASQPSLVVDSKGILHAFWVDNFAGYQYSESADGVAWSAPKSIKFPFNSEGLPPVLIADKQGRVHILWLSDTNVLTYAQAPEMRIASPSTWRGTKRLDAEVLDFDIALDGNGRIHVSYIKNPQDSLRDQAGAYYINSLDGGASWQQKKLLYESPYFRSVDVTSAHVRLAASSDPNNENVYSVWDDVVQKRVYMGISRNGGKDWEPAKEIVAPDAALGFQTPFASDIEILKGKTLLTWQMGDRGVRCSLYSRASTDNGEKWDEPVRVLGESSQCPERSEFLSVSSDYAVLLLRIQGGLTFVAWNGSQWSNAEVQSGPASISNPTTFEAVVLRCQQVVPFNNKLFVIGCDETGGDVWFIARELDPLENLFPLSSAWGLKKELTSVSQKINSLASVADPTTGNIHVLWVQSAASEDEPYDPRFMYAHWNGTEWSDPLPVITELDGLPIHAALAIDSQQRLLLTWVDQSSGDILFSWATSEQANFSLEWSSPVVLPSPSELNNSPSIVVDASNRIVISYAVPLNEQRGIYVTQSTDQGATWSAPQQAFDAVAAGWGRVDRPKLSFTDDGMLHLLFSEYPARDGQAAGILHYSRSANGGVSWSEPETVSENPVEWSDIFTAPQQTVHRLWQEKLRLVASIYHQVSLDGGKTWNAAVKITSSDAAVAMPSVSRDWDGNIHLLQTTFVDVDSLNEWLWSQERWQLIETNKAAARTQNTIVAVYGGITSNGDIYALLQSESTDEQGQLVSDLMSFDRSLDLAAAPPALTASIQVPVEGAITAESPTVQSTSTASPLAGLEDTSSPLGKNAVGLILVIVVIVAILVIVVPRKKK